MALRGKDTGQNSMFGKQPQEEETRHSPKKEHRVRKVGNLELQHQNLRLRKRKERQQKSQRRNIHRDLEKRQYGRVVKTVHPGERQAGFGSILYHLRLCDPGRVALRFLTVKQCNGNHFSRRL